MASPALWMIVAVFASGIGTAYFAGTMGLEECKIEVRAERKKVIQERIKKQEQKTMFKNAGKAAQAPAATGADAGTAVKKPAAISTGIFGTANLRGQAGAESDAAAQEKAPAARPGADGYNNLFQPNNLEKQSGSQ